MSFDGQFLPKNKPTQTSEDIIETLKQIEEDKEASAAYTDKNNNKHLGAKGYVHIPPTDFERTVEWERDQEALNQEKAFLREQAIEDEIKQSYDEADALLANKASEKGYVNLPYKMKSDAEKHWAKIEQEKHLTETRKQIASQANVTDISGTPESFSRPSRQATSSKPATPKAQKKSGFWGWLKKLLPW